MHRYKLHKHVRFFGFVPDTTLAILYRLARVFVFPSLYEGFGLPPLEAMASGTPVITSNVSSLPEVVGDAALLIDPYQPDAIADAMRRVMLDDRLRDDLRERGLMRAREFSWERSVTPHQGDLRRGAGGVTTHAGAEGGARPRLADRDAGRREGARGHLRALSRRRRSTRWCTCRARVSARIEGSPSAPRSSSDCPDRGRFYRHYLPLFPLAVELFDLDGFDLVISSSHCAVKSVIRAARRACTSATATRRCAMPGISSTPISARIRSEDCRAGCCGRSWRAGPVGPRRRRHGSTAFSRTLNMLRAGSADTIIAGRPLCIRQ